MMLEGCTASRSRYSPLNPFHDSVRSSYPRRKLFTFFVRGKGGKPSSAGRAVVRGSFFSGRGVGVARPSVDRCWPLLKKSGYDKEAAGGSSRRRARAIISPPGLGEAALPSPSSEICISTDPDGPRPDLLFYIGIFVRQIDARNT